MLPFRQHKPLYFLLLLIGLIQLFFLSIPFGGDVLYRAEVADYILHQHFASLINPSGDNGTPPLYSLYLALGWSLFGQNLSVSHILFLPFILGFTYQVYLFSLNFSTKNTAVLVSAMALLSPSLSTQAILMGYDFIIAFLFMLGLNAIWKKNLIYLIIATMAIALLHMRGFTIVVALFLIQIMQMQSFSIRKLMRITMVYIPAVTALLLWLMYHHSQSGWYIVSPTNEALHQTKTIGGSFKSILLQGFAMFSNGMFIMLFVAAFGWWTSRQKKEAMWKNYRKVLLIFLLSVLPLYFITAFLAYPASSRYLVYAYPLLFVLAGVLYDQLKKPLQRLWSSILVLSILIPSNYVLNPYPYANTWDCSWKGLAAVRLQEQLFDFMEQKEIMDSTIHVHFPLNQSFRTAYLSDQFNYQFSEYKEGNVPEGQYVLRSNLYNSLDLSKPNNSNVQILFSAKKNGLWLELIRK